MFTNIALKRGIHFAKRPNLFKKAFVPNHSRFCRSYTQGKKQLEKEQLLLISLASEGDVDGIINLLESTPALDVNASDYDGRTALHLACSEGHIEVVKYLLNKGANVHATDRWNNTSLRSAAFHHYASIATLLRERGATLRVEGLAMSELEARKLNNGEQSEEFKLKVEGIKHIFDSLADGVQNVTSVNVSSLEQYLRSKGIHSRNIVVKQELNQLRSGSIIEWDDFLKMMLGEKSIIQLAMYDRLIVKDWSKFIEKITILFQNVQREVHEGKNADYIPELSTVDPELFSVSICTVDGQQFDIGDTDAEFSIQSASKPMLYSLALERYGPKYVHEYVGMEPSGAAFNSFTLNSENKPHNACINAGAIVVCGLMYPELSVAERFKKLNTEFSAFLGGEKAGFNQSVYLSEKDTAHRNKALSYFMASNGAFPKNVDIDETLDFYLQMCSIEVNSNQLAKVAATYANYGVCPTTGSTILSYDTVRRTAQLLFNCGMYDYSGRWANSTGLPAKSGVSGCLYIVVPGVLGMAVYSPRLASHGNTVRGIEFAHRAAETFGWNIFDVVYNMKR
ncbi:hypothetical protein AKO1_009802 [Acrasis kona]|uniref:glutaminase n=1 Tax=Acrasis kona TaxID=1008807 RepID=A0AAW2ZNC7_9EUKA